MLIGIDWTIACVGLTWVSMSHPKGWRAGAALLALVVAGFVVAYLVEDSAIGFHAAAGLVGGAALGTLHRRDL